MEHSAGKKNKCTTPKDTHPNTTLYKRKNTSTQHKNNNLQNKQKATRLAIKTTPTTQSAPPKKLIQPNQDPAVSAHFKDPALKTGSFSNDPSLIQAPLCLRNGEKLRRVSENKVFLK